MDGEGLAVDRAECPRHRAAPLGAGEQEVVVLISRLQTAGRG